MAFIYESLVVDNVTTLKSLSSSTSPRRVDGVFIAVADNGNSVPGWYRYDNSRSDAESLPEIAAPGDDVGRWIAFAGGGGGGGVAATVSSSAPNRAPLAAGEQWYVTETLSSGTFFTEVYHGVLVSGSLSGSNVLNAGGGAWGIVTV